jgi:carbonic anhydrase/acetyltransferase-like protein (isoleucine patch superfamily)
MLFSLGAFLFYNDLTFHLKTAMSKNIRSYLEHSPTIDSSCYVDDMSVVIGDVQLAENVSVWPFAVIRGDVNSIRIGKNSNVQDHCMLHVSHKNQSKPNGSPLIIGEDVTVGHHVTLHGCTIGNRVLVGINTVVLDDVIIEDDVIIGAGSLVPPRKVLKSGFLYVGSPVQQVRPLTEKELEFLSYSALRYVKVKDDYKNYQ